MALGFGAGFGLGKINVDALVRYTTDAYVNQYQLMSNARREHITYYVYSRQADSTIEAAKLIPGVVTIEKAGPEHLFDVVIEYAQRREVVNTLRALPQVSTVFTVPLMCH